MEWLLAGFFGWILGALGAAGAWWRYHDYLKATGRYVNGEGGRLPTDGPEPRLRLAHERRD